MHLWSCILPALARLFNILFFPGFSPDNVFIVLEAFCIVRFPMRPRMSLDWTGDDIGDRAMSMPRPAALRKVNYVHESVPAPRIPPAELGFDNVDNASQISNDEDTDVELADEHCFICARHGKQHRSSESLPPTPGGWDYQEVQRVFFLPTNSNNVNNFRLVMLPHFLNSYAPATLTKVRLSVSRNLARVGAKTPGLKRLRLQLTTLCSTTLRAGMPLS